MAQINNNLVSSANVYPENRYAEFTTLFRIKFQSTEPGDYNCTERWKYIFAAWWDVCARALEARMDSCVSILFRNRDNVLSANEYRIVFKKSNGQIHSFNFTSFKAMEELLEWLRTEGWKRSMPTNAQARQLLKALYWISEEDKQEHGGFGFGQLISCLEEFTFGFEN